MSIRLRLAASIALVVAATMTAQAQYPQSSQTQSPSTQTIAVTGCVQRAQPNPTGTTGTNPSSTSAAKFILTNAALSSSQPAGISGMTNPPATAIASEYRLDTDESTLSSHIGEKVEITGTVEKPSTAEQKPPASAASSPTLKVQNVKTIASTCPS